MIHPGVASKMVENIERDVDRGEEEKQASKEIGVVK